MSTSRSLSAMWTTAPDGRKVSYCIHLIGRNIQPEELSLASVRHYLNLQPTALLFAHASSFHGDVWLPVIDDLSDCLHQSSPVDSLSSFGAVWPAQSACSPAAMPPRLVAFTFDFANHGRSDACVPFPLPGPPFGTEQDGAVWQMQDSRVKKALQQDSLYWVAWRQDVAAVVREILNFNSNASIVGIGHSLGAAALCVAAADFPDKFSRLILYEPAISDSCMPLWGFPPAALRNVSVDAIMNGQPPYADVAETAQTVNDCSLPAELMHRLQHEVLPAKEIMNPFVQSILNRRDQWATLHEAQVYLTRRQMYADLDPRVLKAFWPHALKEMKDLHGNTRVFLQPRAQIEAITYASNAGSLWQNVARAPCRALFIVGPDAFQFGPNTQAQAFALAARFGSALTASKCKPSAALLLKHGHHFFPLAQPKLFARIVRAELMSEFSQTKTSKL